jgi:Na+-transporting methylmalonyl-CoA/oxaloacetate decarboxylase gamma subunit
MGRFLKGSQQPTPVPVPAAAPAVSETNREELVAAISAALAEELGTDITGIRILSLKKV